MSEEQEVVILKTAYSWMCPKCKKLNFARAVDVELTEEDKEHLCMQMGVSTDELGEGQFVTTPDEVTCINPECLTIFKAKDPREE